MRRYLWCGALLGGLLLSSLSVAVSQEIDDFLFLSNEDLNANDLSQMENLAEYYANLREHPLSLNVCDAEDLRQLRLLDEWQIKSLLHYRQSYGRIVSWKELVDFVKGFDEETLRKLQAFCTLEEAAPAGTAPQAGAGAASKHQLLFRYGRSLYRTKAYRNGKYQGDPQDFLFKYTGSSPHLQWGLAAQQDKGEAFSKQGFDAYAGFLSIKDKGFLKNLTLGNFRVEWGYNLHTGMAGGFYGSLQADRMQSAGNGIKGYASGAEYGYLQGAAASFRLPADWQAEAFFSSRKIDGAMTESTDDADTFWDLITALPESGYHRTEAEIEKKESILWQTGGLKVEKDFSHGRIGGIVSAYRFGGRYNPLSDKIRGTARSASAPGVNASLYTQYLFGKWHLYGEYAWSFPRGVALLQGVQWKACETFAFSTEYRHYNRTYYSSYAQIPNARPVSEPQAGKTVHEVDWLACGDFPHHLHLHVSGSFSAQRNHPDLPFYGFSLHAKLWHEGRRFTPALSVFYGQSQTRGGLSLRASLKMAFDNGITAESRLESRNLTQGLLLLQDFGYHTPKGNFQIRFRAVLFDVKDYSNRIYAYEPDVLYAASAPAFYGKGCRLALLLKQEIARGLWVEAKYAHTLYDGVRKTGSGNNEVEGFFLPEIKVQLRYTFRTKRKSR